MDSKVKIFYHLPGLFEFYELYKKFLPIFYEHNEYFYDWCDIGSIYGAPADCLWGGGRVGFGYENSGNVAALMKEYNISSRLTFSNSLLEAQHLKDTKCDRLCRLFEHNGDKKNGIIIYSDLLLDHIRKNYPGFYFVSSTTKVISDFNGFIRELEREEYKYVVADFRLNREFDKLKGLDKRLKKKAEFLCNECCFYGCEERKKCYENVSMKSLGEDCGEHICKYSDDTGGYRFSKAMENPGFIGTDDILDIYAPNGFDQFKIEGRSLGSAVVLEFLLFYLTRPEYRLRLREEIYLDSSLDLF